MTEEKRVECKQTEETWVDTFFKVDEKVSLWVHKKCCRKPKPEKDSLFKKAITLLWKILSISNNGGVWLIISPILVLLSYHFYPHHLHTPPTEATVITMNETTSDNFLLSILLSIYHVFAIEMYKLRFLAICFTFDLIFVGCIKLFISRKRPYFSPENKKGKPLGNHSFPSGHSSRAAILLTLWIYDKIGTITTMDYIVRSIIVFGWTILMGLSRISLARHYTSDVIAGYLIGFAEVGFFMALRPFFPQYFAPPAHYVSKF